MPITDKLLLSALALLVTVAGVVIFVSPPSVFPDPSWGFHVMRSMEKGGAFNVLNSPDPANLAKNLPSFLSWWSPGQYLVPYFFKALFGMTTARASCLTITGAVLCGLAGWYMAFRKLGFSCRVAVLSLVFIACQPAFWIPFAFYNGGEVLLFAVTGWFLYGLALRIRTGWRLALFILLSGWIGFIAKASFIWMYAAGMLALWVWLSDGQRTVSGWFKTGCRIGVPAGLSLTGIYLAYLSKGDNPAASAMGFKFAPEAFEFPVASPLLSGFSLDDLLNGLWVHSNASWVTSGAAAVILALSAMISLLVIWVVLKDAPTKDYRLLLLIFYSVSVLFFIRAYLNQAAISYESRHFRIIGLLIVPGVIHLVLKRNRFWQAAFLLTGIGMAGFSYHFFETTHRGNLSSAHGPSGFAQGEIDQPSLTYLLDLDRREKNALFVFVSADVGLEIQHNRVIILDPYDPGTPYRGHAGRIYLTLPASYSGESLAAMMRYFPDYQNFVCRRLSNNYLLYTAL